MDVQLINAPLPQETVACRRTKAYPPLALLYLATEIRRQLPHFSVEVIDGEITSIADIIGRITAPIVGISSTSFSYVSAVEIAQAVKSLNSNSTVVLGGVHASQMAPRILHNRSCFDIVVEGQGELPMLSVLTGKDIHEIENCWYKNRETDDIEHNQKVFTPVDKLSVPDYSIVDLEPYFSNFSLRYPRKSFHKGLPILSSTGCRWRLQSGGCKFCSIVDTAFSSLGPRAFWDLVSHTCELTGADFLWDVSDTFTSDPRWIGALAEYRPKELPVVFHVYGRPEDITPQVARDLAAIGVQEILLGVESFDDELLRLCNKGTTRDSIFQAVNSLSECDIGIAISLVLGLQGESEVSLRRTLEGCKALTTCPNIVESHVGILIPTPGSSVFSDMLRIPEFQNRYARLDVLPFADVMYDWLVRFTDCGPDLIYDCYERIDALFPSAGPFYVDRNARVFSKASYSDVLPLEGA